MDRMKTARIVASILATTAGAASAQSLDTPNDAAHNPAAVAAAKHDLFCRDIFDLMKAAPSGFEAFKGAYRTDRERWVSTVLMPAADTCSIQKQYNGIAYNCSWSMDDVVSANQTAYDMTRRLRWCQWYGLDYESSEMHGTYDPTRGLYEARMFTHENNLDYVYDIRVRSSRTTEMLFTLTAVPRPDPKGEMPDEMLSDEPVGPRK